MYKPTDADVIIIGGGLAGLTAAFYLHLKEPTLNFIVLEGCTDVGGRGISVPVLSVKSNATALCYFDVGGQWVCREQNHLLNLLDVLKIPTIADTKSGKTIVEYKDAYVVNSSKDIFNFFGPYDKLQFTKFIDKVEMLSKKVNIGDKKIIEQLNEITLDRFIEDSVSSEAVRAVINYIVCFNCGISSWQISALFYVFFCISTRGIANQLPTEDINVHEIRIRGGVKNICDKIADQIGRRNIFTDEYVTDVITTPRYVEVKTGSKSYYCYDVIVAVSSKDILNINFVPPLPSDKVDAIKNCNTNTMTSFVVTYPRNFWSEAGFCGDVYILEKGELSGPIDFCSNVTDCGKPALAGRIFDAKTADNYYSYKDEVLKQLAGYFGDEALTPIDYFEKSCSLGGSYMGCWDVRNEDYISKVAGSNDRIFWAGAETAQEWYGHLAGAVFSGNRAALEVLYDLRPALLTSDDMLLLSPTRRSRMERLKEHPKSTLYYSAVHWKYYLSVGVIVILVLWRCKNKYLK